MVIASLWICVSSVVVIIVIQSENWPSEGISIHTEVSYH